MIGALARAGIILNDEQYIQSAQHAADYLLQNHLTGSRLLQSSIEGVASVDASVDAYAFLIDGLLHLASVTLNDKYIEYAIQLQQFQDDLFFDTENGGYYTGIESSDQIVRLKNNYDGAEPAASSVSILNLQKLFVITGNDHYQEQCQKVIAGFIPIIERYPYTMPLLISNALWSEHHLAEIIVTGKMDNESRILFLKSIFQDYHPDLIVYAPKDSDSYNSFSKTLSQTSDIRIYYCKDMQCSLPVSTVEELHTLFSQNRYQFSL
jgi:uncharacterized protein YyaL (SSP411 family)